MDALSPIDITESVETKSSSLPVEEKRDFHSLYLSLFEEDEKTALFKQKKEREKKTVLLDGPVQVPFIPHSFRAPEVLYKVLSVITTPIIQKIPPLMERGIQKVVISCHVPHLGKMEIILDHFDTAPHSFNVHFQCGPEMQKILIENEGSLLQILQKQFPLFTFHVYPPTFIPMTSYKKNDKTKRSKSPLKQPPVISS